MKKTLFLTIGVFTICCLGSQQVNAQAVSAHYTTPVLKRINMALIGAQNAPTADNIIFLFFSWLDEVRDAYVGLIDIENRLTVNQKDLEEVTPCLQIDLLLLEAKMEEINQQLLLAMAEDRYGDIRILSDILRYTKTRYNHLIIGAMDPQYVDYEFWKKLSFDPDTWCCANADNNSSCIAADKQYCNDQQGLSFETWQECGQVCLPPSPLPGENPPICPFDSNYLPPTKEGYGCDNEALIAANTQLSAATSDEKTSLLLLENTLDSFWNTQNKIRELSSRIDNILAETETENEPREHKRVFGCNLDFTDDSSSDSESEVTVLPAGATRITLRGPFTVEKNHIALLREFEKILMEQGAQREQEVSLLLPSTTRGTAQEQQEAIVREEGLSGFVKYIRDFLRKFFLNINIEQSSKNTLPFAQSLDAQQELSLTFSSMRSSNKLLAELASNKDKGIRKFTLNYAYFLRRSCIYRPCNSALDRILRIVLEDSCFPYANGEFIDADTVTLCKESSEANERL